MADTTFANGLNGVLGLALNAMEQAKIYLGVLFETNIMGGIYMCLLSEYNVLTLEAPSKHQGRLALLFHE